MHRVSLRYPEEMYIMETLASGIVVITLSGLTFLAYKHPDAYQKMHDPLVISVYIVTIGGALWGAGALWGYITIVGFVQTGKLDEARESLNAIVPPLWGIGVAVLVYFYLMFLSALPDILGKQGPQKPIDPIDTEPDQGPD